MNTRWTRTSPLLLLICACSPAPSSPPAAQALEPQVFEIRQGYVEDLGEFAAFIASAPTPELFSRYYPDVQLVLPGQITTREYRSNHSRYFAELDASGRIVGGRFQ